MGLIMLDIKVSETYFYTLNKEKPYFLIEDLNYGLGVNSVLETKEEFEFLNDSFDIEGVKDESTGFI